MQTLQASLRASSQKTCRATAVPSTQSGAAPRAVTNSWRSLWSAKARAPMTTAIPASVTAVGCRRVHARAAASRAVIRSIAPSAIEATPAPRRHGASGLGAAGEDRADHADQGDDGAAAERDHRIPQRADLSAEL